MALTAYKQKRDFTKTAEPAGSKTLDEGVRRFVVQEHHASHLHFDFRFEYDGVLKSWAVPKGFPDTTGIRRLAVMTEDHPVQYLTFSGTIPAGNYGAGEMSIWDTGTYDWAGNGSIKSGLANGKLELILHGDRLMGKYDMIRTDDEKNEWLLIKTEPHDEPPVRPDSAPPDGASLAKVRGVRQATMPKPESTSPMLAEVGLEPFDDPNYQFEIKWDGYRALLFMKTDTINLYSRNHQTLSHKFPAAADMRNYLRCHEAVIDGEIVALDQEGKPDFQSLQNQMGFRIRGRSRKAPGEDDVKTPSFQIVFMAFDLLFVDGRDLTGASLKERRRTLQNLVSPGGPIRFSDHVEEKGKELFHHARKLGLEGIIAKRADSEYVQRRSVDWKKIKTQRTTDVVIGGYTESNSAGRPFAALLLGQFAEDGLRFIGHVGTGYDDEGMAGLISAMKPLTSTMSPFSSKLETNGAPHWLSQELVCEVKFTGVTADGRLRHPVFLHLRPDKPAKECRLDDLNGSGRTQPVGKEPPLSTDEKKSQNESSISELSAGSAVTDVTASIDHHRVKLTHLDKVFWPKTGASKRDLLRYYAHVSQYMLPHLTGRPLVVERFPNGVEGGRFFQHDIGDRHAAVKGRSTPPSFLKTFDIEESNGLVHYPLCDEIADLLYLVNLGAIPIHCWNVTTKHSDKPDRIVWDFDPAADLATAVEAVRHVKAVLDEAALKSFVKTSGANGIHIYVPIQPAYDSDFLIAFATLVAEIARSREPELMTLERRIVKRGQGRVYIDCVQNRVGKTVVAPYSVRPMSLPMVSTPLTWDELTPKLKMDEFTIETLPSRLNEVGDIFAPVLALQQDLQGAVARLATMTSGDEARQALLAEIKPATAAHERKRHS